MSPQVGGPVKVQPWRLFRLAFEHGEALAVAPAARRELADSPFASLLCFVNVIMKSATYKAAVGRLLLLVSQSVLRSSSFYFTWILTSD